VSRHLFQWSADARQADFYERGLLNGILGNMNAVNGTTVDLEYMLPFGDQGLTKPFWSASEGNFPCCWGTLSEAYAKLADSIFFRSPDNTTLFVNLFEPSTVQWDGIELQQASGFPADINHTTTLTIRRVPAQPLLCNRTVALRVPWWADGVNSVTVNGEAVPAAHLQPSTHHLRVISTAIEINLDLTEIYPRLVIPILTLMTRSRYLLVTRTWVVGDKIEVAYAMGLRFENVDDARALYANGYGAIMYGPLLLAGITSERTLILGDNKTLGDVVVRDVSETNAPSVHPSPTQRLSDPPPVGKCWSRRKPPAPRPVRPVSSRRQARRVLRLTHPTSPASR
jgi:DUF1680 family protein